MNGSNAESVPRRRMLHDEAGSEIAMIVVVKEMTNQEMKMNGLDQIGICVYRRDQMVPEPRVGMRAPPLRDVHSIPPMIGAQRRPMAREERQ